MSYSRGTVSIHSCHSRGLIVAAPSYVFTISRVANMLGEDENKLYDIGLNMEPEDGCLTVLGIDDVSMIAFTSEGVENLRNFSRTSRAK